MNKPHFVGTTNYGIIDKFYGTVQWVHRNFYQIPFPVITPPPMFLAAFGSAGISLPTVSPYNQEYLADFNILRQDWKERIKFDVDRYIITPYKPGIGLIYMEPPSGFHHLNPEAEVIKRFDPALQNYIIRFV